MSMYLSNGICFKYLVFLSVIFLFGIVKPPMCNGAVHNNESWMEAVISSPAAEINCGGVTESIWPSQFTAVGAGNFHAESRDLHCSKICLGLCLPNSGWIAGHRPAGWPRAAESILPAAGRAPATVSGDSVPSTCVQLYSGCKGRLTASPYSGRRRFLL